MMQPGAALCLVLVRYFLMINNFAYQSSVIKHEPVMSRHRTRGALPCSLNCGGSLGRYMNPCQIESLLLALLCPAMIGRRMSMLFVMPNDMESPRISNYTIVTGSISLAGH